MVGARFFFSVLLVLLAPFALQARVTQQPLRLPPMWEADILQASLLVRNEYSHPIKLKKVEPGCHCTTVLQFPDKLAAGAQGTIRIEVNASGLSGELRRTVQVYTSDGARHELEYFIDVRPNLTFEPDFVALESIPPGQAAKLSLLLRVHNPAVKVRTVRSDHPAINILQIEPQLQTPSAEWKIDLRYTQVKNMAPIAIIVAEPTSDTFAPATAVIQGVSQD